MTTLTFPLSRIEGHARVVIEIQGGEVLSASLQAEEEAGIAARALQVRKAGTDLITLAGGQFIHPVKAVVGGVNGGIPPDPAARMRGQLIKALSMACGLVNHYWQTSFALRHRIGTWGDDEPACYIAACRADQPNYDGDAIRVMAVDGLTHLTFSPHAFRDHLSYEETDLSYAGQTSYQGAVLRANSLARINLASQMGTTLADEYLERFREAFGRPAHGILLFDLCRGIELVYALERALRVAARRYITPERIHLKLERAVGRVVRAFDPCISCATH